MRPTDRPYIRLATYVLILLVPVYGAFALYSVARRLWIYPALASRLRLGSQFP